MLAEGAQALLHLLEYCYKRRRGQHPRATCPFRYDVVCARKEDQRAIAETPETIETGCVVVFHTYIEIALQAVW